ncbi:methyltransferase [Streptomyces sp. DW26H14]|uniref:methyltransferase n=1 Tax=Streptomyces sp. DW26H14 TaxID=3435395 RepID=UPI00403E1D0A
MSTGETASVLAGAAPGLSAEARTAMGEHVRFAHAAVLVFPPDPAALRDTLRAMGLPDAATTSSVVVRERLSRRHGCHLDGHELAILRVPVPGADGQTREMEIFSLPVPPGSGLEFVADAERARPREPHLALEVKAPDHVVLAGLRAALLDGGAMACDGGGYNPYEDNSVLYFSARDGSDRLELIARGRHDAVVAAHRAATRGVATSAGEPPANTLLRLMTGAWATQAIAVAAELGLADRLAGAPVPVPALAASTGTDPVGLARLLRYLGGLGLVTLTGGVAALTDVGQLLRTDVPRSLHPLAVIYGGTFYESFGSLAHSVRTGREAFTEVFGEHHFDYFAGRPEFDGLFDRAMAASVSMLGGVTDLVDFSSADVVVDVAGGNGQLLGLVLAAAPHLRGVLFDRAHAVAAAGDTLTRAGVADRCELVPGDFTVSVPGGGDVYLLSRVLHDWDDERCATILRNCAEAMPANAELLVLERLLPEDDSPSLALAWDVHMLCNVGGRERTASHYRSLLADAGFECVEQHELPLEMAVLRARRAGRDSSGT